MNCLLSLFVLGFVVNLASVEVGGLCGDCGSDLDCNNYCDCAECNNNCRNGGCEGCVGGSQCNSCNYCPEINCGGGCQQNCGNVGCQGGSSGCNNCGCDCGCDCDCGCGCDCDCRENCCGGCQTEFCCD